MKHLYKIIWSFFILALFSCQPETEMEKVQFIGLDKISRVELHPNSPQLIANGKAELKFKVKLYYKNGEDEVAMIADRVPLNEIQITSSDGKTFAANQGYSTTATTDSAYFTCTVGDITSSKASVRLTSAEQPNYEKVVVPIIFHAVYSKNTKNNVKEFTPELLQRIVDRANKVFAGELNNAPSSCNSGIRFEIARINMAEITVSKTEWGDSDSDFAESAYNYISEHLMIDPSTYLNIWVMDFVSDHGPFGMSKCVPKYTFGDPEDIPGLRLTPIADESEIEEIRPEDVGIGVSFAEMYHMMMGRYGVDTERFEMRLGAFYGLLSTGRGEGEGSNDDEYNGGDEGGWDGSDEGNWDGGDEGDWEEEPTPKPSKYADLDYCDDTFSYEYRFFKIEKKTFPLNGEESGKFYLFDSYNIMDEFSACNTISRDQVKRIRQVMNDCALRQMRKQ